MRMTWTGALRRAFAAPRPPKPPPTITTRGVFDSRPSAPSIELRLASFIHPFLKLLRSEISQKLLSPTDWWESRAPLGRRFNDFARSLLSLSAARLPTMVPCRFLADTTILCPGLGRKEK